MLNRPFRRFPARAVPVPMTIRTLEKGASFVREMTSKRGDVIVFPEALCARRAANEICTGLAQIARLGQHFD